MNLVNEPEPSVRACRDEDGMDGPVGTFAVVSPQITSVGVGLVDIGLADVALALQLEDDDHAILEHDDVRAARLAW